VRGCIRGLGRCGWRAGQAWFRRHPIRREGLSIREHVFVIGHGVGVQAGLAGVGPGAGVFSVIDTGLAYNLRIGST